MAPSEDNPTALSFKQCLKCKCVKPLTDFPGDRSIWDGFQSRCKSCKAANRKPYLASHPRRQWTGGSDKRCSVCQAQKPLHDFPEDRRATSGRGPQCRDCSKSARERVRKAHPERHRASAKTWREAHPDHLNAYSKQYRIDNPERHRIKDRKNNRKNKLKHSYGLTIRQFDAMVAIQEGRCAICASPFDRGRNPHIDHDHGTGRVRGLLCGLCNSAIGLLRDDQTLLLAAVEYLKASVDYRTMEIT